MTATNLSHLYEFCTVRQLEYVQAVEKAGGNKTQAAKALGINVRTFARSWDGLMKKASLHSPQMHDYRKESPPLFPFKGVSQLVNNRTNEVALTWYKSSLKDEKYLELIKGAIVDFMADVPEIPVAPCQHDYQDDIIPWLQIGDGHLGMLSHHAETGRSFDLDIAEEQLCTAIAMLIDEMPACARMVVNDLGDMTHYDNLAAKTSKSGHDLDYDTRMHKMIRVYVRTMKFIVERCMTKALHLDVIVNPGNHSGVNDIWMPELLRAAYGHTGRVTVLDNRNPFIGYRMGKTFVMTNHTDKAAAKDLVGVMITDFREDFGECEFHYIDTGHQHHRYVVKEHPSVVIECWNNLAPNDKHHHEFAYRSRQLITLVLRSKTFGEKGRRVLSIQEVEAFLQRTKGTKLKPKRLVHTV